MAVTKNPNKDNDKAAAKRAAVLGAEKKSRGLPLAAIIPIVLAIAGGGYLFLGNKGAVPQAAASSTPVTSSAREVVFPVSDFADGQARYYQYTDGSGPTVRYYVVKASDGVLRTAYDACDACWPEGKGYKQAGEAMICQNCQRSFEILRIGEVHGGCNPAPLTSRVQDGKLVIETKDILAGRRYFDFPKGN
jgi:uncharacterized membrane protein